MKKLYKNLILLLSGISLAYGMNQDHREGQLSTVGGNYWGQKKQTKSQVSSNIGELGCLPLELLTIIFKKALQPKWDYNLTTEPISKGIEAFIRKDVTCSIRWFSCELKDEVWGFLNGRLEGLDTFKKRTTNGGVYNLLYPLLNFSSLLSYLTKICIAEVKLTDSSFSYFPRYTNLTSLELNCDRENDIADKVLASISNLTNLKRLALSRFYVITAQGFPSLSNLINLTSLKLKGLIDLPDDIISIIAKLSKLTDLNLSESNGVDDAFAQVSKLENLLSLNLSHAWADVDVPSLSRLTKLTSLNLRGDFGDHPLNDTLSCLSNLVNLTSLDLLGSSRITDVGLSHISRFTNLTDLNLGLLDSITDNGLVYLSNFKGLTSLCLIYCIKLTGDGLSHLSKCTNLHTLNLRGCKNITDQGLLYLSNFTKLTMFNFLKLRITDQGLFRLFASANFKHIRRYDVIDCSLSEWGYGSIEGLVLRNYHNDYPFPFCDERHFHRWKER